MLTQVRETSGPTGYALFDNDQNLEEADPDFFGGDLPSADKSGLAAVVAAALKSLHSFDGRDVEATEKFAREAAARWAQGDVLPVEAETLDGRWKLLTSHPRPHGGVALVSVDITAMKRAQDTRLEDLDILRCISDSHPLPVWVVDEESREIIYESLDASVLLGRKWKAHERQYLSSHFASAGDFDEIAGLAAKAPIVRDRELKLKRADGSTVWCSANCRRAAYRGRPSLVIGVLDITERKQREDLFGFLIKHLPLPVWMNDADTGAVIYQSDAAKKLFGWGDESKGRQRRPADHFVDRAEFVGMVRELRRSGVVENHEAALRDAEGRKFWATGNMRVVDFQGRKVVLAGIADVTKQKKRSREVKLAREMLANAIESLSEGFALYDEDQRLVMSNRLYRELNGPVAELIQPGMSWVDMLRESARRGFYAEAIGREEEWVQERLRNRAKYQSHYESHLADGRWHSISMHRTDLGGFVVTRGDISERKRAEEAEREATALLQRVLDACPTPTRMTTLDGETLYRNPASRALYGDRRDIADYYVDQADRAVLLATLTEQRKIDDFRVRQYKGDDSVFWASVSARLIDFKGRQVIVSNTTDITDLVAAREQTRQANERLIDAIESLSEGFALYDRDDRLVLANSRYRMMHAKSADVLVPGVNWFDFLRVTAERKQFPVDPDRVEEWLAERARDRREFRQAEFQHTDGGWFFVSNCPTREGGFVVTRVDITERKRAELAAKEADEMVRNVLEACSVNIQMTRAHDGKLLYRSPATIELLGDVGNATEYYVSPAERERYVERLLEEGAVDDFETQLWRKDGTPCWCSISSRLIDFHGDKVIISHTYDLTDHIRMQKELEAQRETLHQNEKMSALGGLLAGVAHELNNPLSVVLGLSSIMKETAADPKSAERAGKIAKAAERCARIVKTFLAMARQKPASTSNVAIDEIIATAVEVAGYSIRSSGIELVTDLKPGLPAIWADPDQLSQVLINLLVNAEQAMHDWERERKITIATSLGAPAGNVVLEVIDTGPGIPQEILPRIFEPFFTTKDVGAGTGIGLSFCHRIVQSHGGTIHAETSPAGTTFAITLPPSTQRHQAVETAAEETPQGGGLWCLVVDDEQEVGELIADVLDRTGFRVVVAGSGEEALRQLKARSFALILSDLKMPNMDGRQLFRYISDFHPSEVGKLAFLTGDTISPDAQAFLRTAKRPYLEKPLKPADLRSFVSKLVDQPA